MGDDESYIHDLTDGKTLVDSDDLFPQGIGTKAPPKDQQPPKEVPITVTESSPGNFIAPTRTRSFAGIPMAPVRSATSQTNINILIYGRPGSGKTRLTATAELSPAMSPMLYISAEAGSSTLKQVSKDIMVIPDPEIRGSVTWEEFETIYDELDRQCYNTKDGPDFRTVAVDTGTELQKINMVWVMKETLSAHPDRDPDVPGLHDWGKSTNRMRTVIRRFRDLPMNFIMVCHEQEDRDNKGLLWKKPDLPGKLANQAAAF